MVCFQQCCYKTLKLRRGFWFSEIRVSGVFMGSSWPVTIHFNSKLKNCFVNVSPQLEREWSNIWKDDNIVKAIHLDCDNTPVYTSWSGNTYQSSDRSHAIEISGKFGLRLGLTDGQEVVATPLNNVASCIRVTFAPASQSDWEIAESNANLIETILIHQLRIIWDGAIIPIWIQKNNCLVVTVGEIDPPSPCSQVEEYTEVRLRSWKDTPSTKAKASKEAASNEQNYLEIPSVSTTSSSPQSTDSAKSENASFNRNTSVVKSSFNLSLGRSLHQAGDKYEQSRTPVYPVDVSTNPLAASLRVGVANLVKAIVFGPHSAEVDNSEKSLFYAITNKASLPVVKTADTSMSRTKKTSSDLFSRIPIESYYRVQDLALSSDVATSRKAHSRIQSSPKNLLEQPSTVFVYCPYLTCTVNNVLNDKTALDNDVLSNKNAVITASIHKMYSVKEKMDLNSSGKRSDMGSNDNTPNDDLRETDPVKLFERKRLESSVNFKQRTVSSGERGSFASLPTTIIRLVLTSQKKFHIDEDSANCSLFGEELLPEHVAVNGLLRRQLKLGVKSTVQIKRVFHKPSPLMGIVLNPFGEDAKKVKTYGKNEIVVAFTSWILETTKEYPLVLASRMLIAFNITPDIKCEFLLSGVGNDNQSSTTRTMQYYFVSEKTLQKASITVGEVIQPSYYLLLSPYPSRSTDILDQDFIKCPISSLGGVDQIYQSCLDFLLHGLCYQPVSQQLCHSKKPSCNTLLLYSSGSTAGGSGKSSLAYALCNQLGRHPNLAHVSVIDCISLRGKRVETIRKSWQQTFNNSAWHQPAVVLFDDLDQLVSAPSLLQEHGPEAHYSLRLAQVFKNLLKKELKYNSQVVVIATVTSRDSIHPSLLTSHGNHVFNKTVEVPLPALDQRALMINAILRRKDMCLPSEEIRVIAVKTEGCSPKDLTTLVARAFQINATKRNQLKQDSSSIRLQDFSEALKYFKPASLHGIKLHQGIDLRWKDVGGLEEIKRTLMETLEWPAKFPELFANVPMRLPSGILLYGPPGTGKTMLAGVVAKECSLNFISIKGPELLSKYIGASEQAVRDLFHRAQSAKPCVLFFDEFDSMAPRRGHDSTGVTDRVVNQLLTQLDGVEGLDGVYILGATSRPDLIDPALLRPGRLDKSLYCGMPEEKDRLEILKALSGKLNLHHDVDLEMIARETVDFSGADLKALLSNAQLERIHQIKTTTATKGKLNKPESTSGIICMPQLKHGPQELPFEESTELEKQVAVLQDNFFKNVYGKANPSPKPDLTQSITIQQDDIMKALFNMAPSVSPEERIKYASIYNSFRNPKKSVSRQIPVIKQRATLA